MGSRGPARTPLSTLKARGSTLRYEREDAPVLDGTPEPPPWMPAEARPYWDYVLTIVHPSILAKQDGPHLAELSMELQKREEVKEKLAKLGGEIAIAEKKGVRWAVKLIREMSVRIDKLYARLGMNPADRSTVAPAASANKGKVGKFVGVA